jgi:hypothetical protein
MRVSRRGLFGWAAGLGVVAAGIRAVPPVPESEDYVLMYDDKTMGLKAVPLSEFMGTPSSRMLGEL